MPLTIVLNGQSKVFGSLSDSSTLEDLIVEIGLKSDRVAVEQNGEIVGRASWPATALREGDRLEVVHFVGGGCIAG